MADGQRKSERIQQVIEAIRNGNKHRARFLIQAELRENPESIDAWSWACDLTKSTPEKILCLRKILSIDPDHEAAQLYLNRLKADLVQGQQPQQDFSLQKASRQQKTSRQQAPPHLNLIDILLTPFAWLFNISLPAALVLLLISLSFAGFSYYRLNTSLLGLARLNFSQLTFSPDQDSIQAPDYSWDIMYENSGYATFSGTVRHVSPIRIDELRILTHDVLVTTGDYANPELVKTDVINHRFFWRAPYTEQPAGAINLLHIIPANREVSARLYEIRTWQKVQISGREILNVKAYNRDGEYLMSWKDTGCNTILVDQVQIIEEQN